MFFGVLAFRADGYVLSLEEKYVTDTLNKSKR